MSNTPNFSFNLPTVGGDTNSWGTILNSNWQLLDTILNGGGNPIVLDGYTVDGVTLTGDSIITAKSVTFTGAYSETAYSLTGSGTEVLDATKGTIQLLALTGAKTLTDGLSNGQSVLLRITGSSTITWTAVDQWIGGSAPLLSASSTNWVLVWKVAGTVYASYIGASS